MSRPENPFLGFNRPDCFDGPGWESYEPEDPESPLWHPLHGFRCVVEWVCGCRLHGVNRKPLSLKAKHCPLHRCPAHCVGVECDRCGPYNPGYRYVNVDNWPPGTFAEKSKRSMRRMTDLLNQAERYAASIWGRSESAEKRRELETEIALVRQLIDAALEPRKPRPKVFKIPKSA